MRVWTEEGYKKLGYTVLIGGRYTNYDTLQEVYNDFKEDFTNGQELTLLQCLYKVHPNHVDEIYERVATVKNVESLQFFCKLFKCE